GTRTHGGVDLFGPASQLVEYILGNLLVRARDRAPGYRQRVVQAVESVGRRKLEAARIDNDLEDAAVEIVVVLGHALARRAEPFGHGDLLPQRVEIVLGRQVQPDRAGRVRRLRRVHYARDQAVERVVFVLGHRATSVRHGVQAAFVVVRARDRVAQRV